MKFGARAVESLLYQLTFLFVIDRDMFLVVLEAVFYKTILQPSN